MSDRWCHRCQTEFPTSVVKYTQNGLGRIAQRLCDGCATTKLDEALRSWIYDLKIVPIEEHAVDADGLRPWERECPSCGAAPMEWCTRHGETLAGPLLMCAVRSRDARLPD